MGIFITRSDENADRDMLAGHRYTSIEWQRHQPLEPQRSGSRVPTPKHSATLSASSPTLRWVARVGLGSRKECQHFKFKKIKQWNDFCYISVIRNWANPKRQDKHKRRKVWVFPVEPVPTGTAVSSRQGISKDGLDESLIVLTGWYADGWNLLHTFHLHSLILASPTRGGITYPRVEDPKTSPFLLHWAGKGPTCHRHTGKTS